MLLKRVVGKLDRELSALFFGGYSPDFLIVGAQKSGTTSLYNYLAARDGFLGAKIKEVHYFDREDHFKKGGNWYRRNFYKRPFEKGLFFEASPEYLSYHKVPLRAFEFKSDMKIIIVLREPIARAYSAWNMYREWSEGGYVPKLIDKDHYGYRYSSLYLALFKNGMPSFSEYIDLEFDLIASDCDEEEPSIIRRGVYQGHVESYVDLFGKDNVLIVGFRELKQDSEAVVRRCFDFLDVEYKCPKDSGEFEIKNQRSYPAKLSDEDRERLVKFYEPHNKRLFEYLGYQPNW